MDITFSLIVEQIKENNSSMPFALLRGTILLMYSTIYTYALMAQELDESIIYINHGFLVVIEFLNKVKQDIKEYSIDIKI